MMDGGHGYPKRTIDGLTPIDGLDTFEKQMYEPLFRPTHPAGVSFDPFQNYDLSKDSDPGWFYSWSLNLFNEEIVEIAKSDGIIGLLLDPRQLGAFSPNYMRSYESLGKSFDTEIDSLTEDDVTPYHVKKTDLNRYEYLKSEPLLRNIFFIVKTIRKEQDIENNPLKYPTLKADSLTCKDPWNLMALGSDYDGLIDPIDYAPTSSYLPLLQRRLIIYAYIFSKIHSKEFQESNGQPYIKSLKDSKSKINKIFFENGRDFIINYF